MFAHQLNGTGREVLSGEFHASKEGRNNANLVQDSRASSGDWNLLQL